MKSGVSELSTQRGGERWLALPCHSNCQSQAGPAIRSTEKLAPKRFSRIVSNSLRPTHSRAPTVPGVADCRDSSCARFEADKDNPSALPVPHGHRRNKGYSGWNAAEGFHRQDESRGNLPGRAKAADR